MSLLQLEKNRNTSQWEVFLLWLAASSASAFLYFSKLEETLVSFFFDKLLETTELLYVATLDTSVVTASSDLLNNASTLNTLLEASDDVCAAFVVVFINCYVCCHMWAREYHF